MVGAEKETSELTIDVSFCNAMETRHYGANVFGPKWLKSDAFSAIRGCKSELYPNRYSPYFPGGSVKSGMPSVFSFFDAPFALPGSGG